MKKLIFSLVVGLSSLCAVSFADPFNSGLDDMTSVSGSYGARDTRVHPAGLGFDSELNGSEFQSIFNTGVRPNANDDYGIGLSYGPLGFNWERRAGQMNRYLLAFGTMLTPKWFFGHRVSLNRYYNSALSYDGWDSGLQFRPLKRLAFGLMVKNWNLPPSGGVKLPAETVLGTTVRVTDSVDLSLDGISNSDRFLKKVDAQIAASWMPAEGVRLQAGYHTVRQWQLGLQLDFDYGSVISTFVPRAADRMVTIGMTSGPLAQKTVLAPSAVLHVRLDSSLVEEGNPSGLFRSEHPSLLSVLEKFRKIRESQNVRSVLLEIDSFSLGLAAAQELHSALLDLRAAGIAVEAHLGQAGLKEYLIASAAAKIHMEPEGELRFLGVKSERYYIKGTLEKLGVEGQFLARGKYKSAPEMFMRTEASPVSRQTQLEELERAETLILSLLTESRKITTQRWKQMQQTALYSSGQAKEAGLIDSVLPFRTTKQKLDDSMRITETVARRSRSLSLPDRVAVVVADGAILQSRSGPLSFGGQRQVTPGSFQKKLNQAIKDPRTKAIVVRVSSPGGEVMASQELAELVKDAKADKPVIVSMGDMAASGGYYMSAPATRIFVNPLTLTGSIGVFMGKFQFAGLYKWLKLNKEIISKSPYPGLFSEDRAWSPAELQVMTQRLNTYYENFVGFVASSRAISKEKADEAAQGRVWLGDQAKQLKLADELGGYIPALRYAAEAGGADWDHLEWWEVQIGGGMFPWSEAFADAKAADALSQIVGKTAASELQWARSLEKNPYLYLSPIQKFE